MATPSKTASLVLNIAGSQSIALKRGEKTNVITKAGQRYRVVKEGEEAEAKDNPAQAAKDVAASQQGQDLLLNYADGTQVALVNFYETCKVDQCAVDMPGAKGTGSSGGYVITGDSPVGETLSGGGKLVYAYGETTSLASLTQGAGQVQGFSQQDSLITYIPTSHASALWNPLPLGLGAVGAAVLLKNSDVKTVGSTAAGSAAPEVHQPAALAKGLVMAGPVVSTNDLKVFLYQADEVTLIGEVTLDDTGRFEINLNGYVGVVVAKVTSAGSNFDYMDEATGQVKNLDFELGAVGVASADGIVIYVNPLTAVAKLLLGSTPLTQNLVEEANNTVAQAFGISGSLIAPDALTPIIDVDGNGQVGADPYGKILAAMSGLDERNSGDMSAAIRAFSNDIQANGGALSAESKAYLVLGASDPQVQTMVPGIVAEIVASTQFTDAEMQSAINTLPGSLTALLQPTLQLVASIPLTRTVTTPSAALAADTGTSTSDGITSNGRMNVTGLESGATWDYSTDNGSTWSPGSGTSFTLTAGSYTSGHVQVRQTDAAGNVSAAGSTSATITVDSSAAAAPSLALAVDTAGTSSSDGITRNGQMNVSGLESGATWDYSTDNGGTWSAGTGTSFTLAAGSYTSGHVQVRQTDAAGNVSAVGSTSAAITVDSAAAAPSVALAADTGTSTSDGITSNGQMNVTGLESGATWDYSTDNGGNWSAGTGTSFTLAAGSYTSGHVQVRQTDAAGNVSAAFTLAMSNVDGTAFVSIDPISGDGTVDSIEKAAGVTVSGTTDAENGQLVSVTFGGATQQVVAQAGAWSTNFTTSSLIDGLYVVTANATDLAGNIAAQASRPVTIMSISAPVINVIAADDKVNIAESGSWAISGSRASSTAAVSLKIGNLAAVTPTYSGTSWTYTLSSNDKSSLGNNGTFVVEATQTINGIISPVASRTILVDRQVLPVLIDPIDTNINAADWSQPITFTGTNEAGITALNVKYLSTTLGQATVSDTAWSYTLTSANLTTLGTGTGTRKIDFSQTDAVGNVSSTTTSGNVTLSVDLTAPSAPILSSSGILVSTDGTTTVSDYLIDSLDVGGQIFGTKSSDSSVVKLNFGGTTKQATTFPTTTTWSYTVTSADILEMGQGLEGLTITAEDAAGNVSAALAQNIRVNTEVIDLGAEGKLILPVQVDGGRTYYFWDRDGDGLATTLDVVSHDTLDSVFKYNIDGLDRAGRTDGGSLTGTDNIFRYATLNKSGGGTVDLALPTFGAALTMHAGLSPAQQYLPLTSVGSASDLSGANPKNNSSLLTGSDAVNASYDDYAAIWDAFNGNNTGTQTTTQTQPPGWLVLGNQSYQAFWTATQAKQNATLVYENQHIAFGFNGYIKNSTTIDSVADWGVSTTPYYKLFAAVEVLAADVLAPVITSAANTVAVTENSGSGQVIYTVQATDNTRVSSYTLKANNNDDAALLSINGSTGAVTLSGNPDFETKSSYAFTVVASDQAGNRAEQALTLTITDVVDETPPQFTSGGAATTLVENSGSAQLVYTAQATDAATMTYSLKATGDRSAFTIDATTGAVSLTGNPDFEAKASYAFTVIATDASGNASEQAVTLVITDIDDTPPTANLTAVADDVGGISGNLSSGAKTDDSALVLSGTNEAGSTVAVYDGTSLLGSATVSGTGWTYLVSVADGQTYQLNVIETDTGGQASAPTSNFTVTGDSTAPTPSSTTAGVTTVGGNLTVQSTEAGTVYMVNASQTITDLASLQALSDSTLFKSISIGAAATNTSLSTSGLNEGEYKLYAVDAAGNMSTPTTVFYDAVAPTVTAIAITSAPGVVNNTLVTGNVVDITMTFSENVTVTNVPRFGPLYFSGSQTRYADYYSGSGTNALVFRYTIEAGLYDTDGIEWSGSKFSPTYNGASIKDAAGNAYTSTQPLGATGSGAQSSYKVDAAPPTVTLSSSQSVTTPANVSINPSDININGGTAYLVNTSVTVTSVASILAAADNLWNALPLTVGGTQNMATTGLLSGTYKLYAADALGNFNATGSAGTATLSRAITTFTFANALDDQDETTPQTLASSGSGATTRYTDDLTPTLQGNFGAGTAGANPTLFNEVVRIYDKGTEIGQATVTVRAGAQSTWSYTDTRSDLVDGYQAYYTVDVTDGTNTKTILSALPLVFDTVAPTLTSNATVSVQAWSQQIYTATSADTNTVTYSLKAGVGDATLLNVYSDGSVWLKTGGVNPAVKPSYSFTLVATDAAKNSAEFVIVAAIPEPPVFTSNPNATVNELLTDLYTAAATDATAVTYSLKSAGQDESLLSINSSTGLVSLASGVLNYEQKSQYDFTVIATDAAGDAAEQAVTVTLNNLDEDPPAFTSVVSDTPVEGTTFNPVYVLYTAAASDPATDGGPGTIRYSLKSGAGDEALLRIDSTTGEVTLASGGRLDYEGKSSYGFTVIASDGRNPVEQTVSISVVNEDESAPTITSGSTASFAENLAITQPVYHPTWTDLGDISGGVTISLDSTLADDAALFEVDANGDIVWIASPDFETPADGGTNNVYQFTVIATDTAGNYSSKAVSLTVTDFNENGPSFSSSTTATALVENSGAGQTIYTAVATAPNSGSVTYSLKANTGDQTAFTIDSTTGAVTLVGSPDFETKASYSFTVVATDSNSVANEQTVSLAITDVDESAPVFTSASIAGVDENLGTNQQVYTALATDASAPVTYSLKAGAGDYASFSIAGNTGAVRLLGNPDHETQATYSFTVIATDNLGYSSERAVTLNVNNLDDTGPVFSSAAQATSISELSGANQLVYTATASDVSNPVTYRLKANTGDATSFTISSGGAVRLLSNPDYEDKSSYSFTVIATDALNQSTELAVSLSILDVAGDTAPLFTSSATVTALQENSNLNNGWYDDARTIYTATATDDTAVTYSLKSGSGEVGAYYGLENGLPTWAIGDQYRISINPSTGEVRAQIPYDFEQYPAWHFTVVATDAQGNRSELAATQAVINQADVVVFDMINDKAYQENASGQLDQVNGQGSFLAGVTYDILLLVDSDSSVLNWTDANHWLGGANLGEDDQFTLVGNAPGQNILSADASAIITGDFDFTLGLPTFHSSSGNEFLQSGEFVRSVSNIPSESAHLIDLLNINAFYQIKDAWDTLPNSVVL